jgi:hypothetical protein
VEASPPYGGAAGGRHAVLHLENVLTEQHAVTSVTAGYAKILMDQLAR